MPGVSLQCHCSEWHSWWLVPGTKSSSSSSSSLSSSSSSSSSSCLQYPAGKSHSKIPYVFVAFNLKDSWGKGELTYGPIHVVVSRFTACISPLNTTDKKDEPSSLLLANKHGEENQHKYMYIYILYIYIDIFKAVSSQLD